jgi:hypothetical protein
MIRLAFSLALVLILVGCKSHPLGPYVSPRVTGQVFDADTQQPLAGVHVIRGSTHASRESPPKGAEFLMRKPPVQTGADGRFEVPSERVLSIVRGAGWDVIPLRFEREGYLHFTTNCPTTSLTNVVDGEPLLDVGRILLQPAR